MKIKGHEINPITVRDSHFRRSQKYQNNIVESLRKLGLTADDVDIKLERVAFKNVPADVVWWIEGHRCHYSYKRSPKYVENLYVISKVIEAEVAQVLSGEKPIVKFCRDFAEEDDVHDERIEARKTLGLADDEMDWKTIDRAYKKLSMKHHPDMENGDNDIFQEVNKAHKVIKRELE